MFNLKQVPIPDLTGKTILVTGAGRGIGAALVNLATQKGAYVFAGIYSGIEDEVKFNAEKVQVLTLDVTSDESVAKAVELIARTGRGLDALVNNAGVIERIGHVANLSNDDMRQAFEVNFFGVQKMTCAMLPFLEKSKGVVINAGTGAATTPMEGWVAYCSSKASARMLTQIFALEGEHSGVQYFFLGIPPTDTEMQAEIRQAGLNPISKIPQKDLVNPDIPASAMAWLCSDDARKVKEVILDVRQEPFQTLMGL